MHLGTRRVLRRTCHNDTVQSWIFPMRSRPAVLLASLFGILTMAVFLGITDAYDEAAVTAAREMGGNPLLDVPVQVATETGDIWYMLGLGIILVVMRRTRRLGVTLMIVLVLSTILAAYVKCGMDRERPTDHYDAIYLPVEISRDTFALFCEGGVTASYPSGHALRSVTVAILLGFALYVRFPRGSYLLFVYAGAVSISRVLTLQHYPTDVIAGILLGILLTGILASQTRLHETFHSKT